MNKSAKNYRFTVVIPTRERCDTLEHTLRTCVMQDYDNLEIIVSDNFSQDDTRQVVNSFKDNRIRYINTGKRLSMSHNWEFALSHVQGDYVTFVGDDDGLLPGALASLAEIIHMTGAKAITWKWASYFWPSCILEASRGLLIIPLSGQLEKRSTAKTLAEVLDFKCGYEHLPFLYKGIVSVECIDTVKKKSGGTFFHSMNPDMYSAIALASAMDEYYYSSYPYSLNGTSGHSNGASQFHGHLSKTESKKFLSEDNIPFHPQLVLAPSHPIAVAECFFQARECMPALNKYSLSIEKMLEAVACEIRNVSSWQYAQVVDAAKEIAERHDLISQAKAIFDATPNTPSGPSIGLLPGFNFVRRQVIIQCKDFEVFDIYSASLLCSFILKAKTAGLRFSIAAISKATMTIAKGLAKRMANRFSGN